jgi:hypothetical protein
MYERLASIDKRSWVDPPYNVKTHLERLFGLIFYICGFTDVIIVVLNTKFKRLSFRTLICVRDDQAFPWKHAIFRYLPSRNSLTSQNEISYDRLLWRDYPTYQKWLGNRLAVGGPTDRWNIAWKTFLLYLALPYLTFLLLIWLYNWNSVIDLHARWLKQRDLVLGSAFWGRFDTK